MMQITIPAAFDVSLVDSIVKLEEECFDHPYSFSQIQDAWKSKSSILGYASTTNLAEGPRSDSLGGYVLLQLLGEDTELHRIAVHPSHQRKGIARTLLSHVFDFLRTTDAQTLFLEVSEYNRNALRFYQTMEFQEVSRRKNYYSDGASAILFKKPLILS